MIHPNRAVEGARIASAALLLPPHRPAEDLLDARSSKLFIFSILLTTHSTDLRYITRRSSDNQNQYHNIQIVSINFLQH